MDHTELVPGTLGNAGGPPSNNDSLTEYIVSLYPPNNTSPSTSQVKTSSGSHIWGNIDSQNVSITTQDIYSCPLGENQPRKDITQCCNSGMISSVGGIFFISIPLKYAYKYA